MVREYLRQVARFSRPARLFLLVLFLFYFGQAAVWVLRNLFLQEAGLDESLIGTTLSASNVGAVVIILLLMRVMDRFQLKGFLLAGAIIVATGLAGVAAWPQPATAVAFSFVTGMGMGLMQVAVAPFFVRHSTEAERPYLFGVGTALLPMAALVGTLGMKVGGVVWGENLETYRGMMYVAAAAVACSFLVMLFLREKTCEKKVEKKEEPEKFDWAMAWKFCIVQGVVGLGAGLTIPFINLYFRNRFDAEVGNIGLFFAGAQSVLVVAFLLSPVFAKRFGPIRTIVFFQLASIPFFFMMAFTQSLAVAVTAFLIRQTCMNMVHPVGDNFMMEVVKKDSRTRANAMKQLAWRFSWVVATATSGFLIKHTSFVVDGFTVVMLITIGCYLVGTGLFWGFFRKTPNAAGLSA